MTATWIRVIFWLYLFVMIWTEGTVTNPADPDLWHRLALGEYLLHQHHFPPGGTFSYLADYQQIADHEWGCGVLFYLIYTGLGGSAMVGLKLVTLLVTMAFLVWAGFHGRRPTVFFAAFYGMVVLALLPAFQSTLRCMAFTHVFFALWLFWFQRERHEWPVPSWAYALTMVFWVNLHGGFSIGLAWLLAVAVVQGLLGQPWKIWAQRFGLCAAASLVNPFGWNLWYSTGRALLVPRRDFDEWAPLKWWPNLIAYPGYKVLVVGTVICLAALLYRRGWRKLDRTALLLIAGALALSFKSARHMSFFAMVAAALLPDMIPHEPALRSIENPIRRLSYLFMRFSLVLIPFYLVISMLPGQALTLEYPSNSCPAGAIHFLRQENVRGKLLVPFNYGSYALWHLRGRMRVSMDGRYDLVYTPATYDQVQNFFQAQGDWRVLLHSPQPNAVLVPVKNPVYAQLQAEPGWTEAYHDATDAIFLPR
jgi:hypothetical protein